MRTPLIYVQTPWLAGWIYFVLCGVLTIAAALTWLISGRAVKADAMLAAKSLQEQIEEEQVHEKG